jgi:hypothetical protein
MDAPTARVHDASDFATTPLSGDTMSDAPAPVPHDHQPLSDDQLSEIAGGGGRPGMISVDYPCDVCGELFTSNDALTRHKSQKHPV